MKFYGKIKTNLSEVLKKYNKEIDLRDIGYSIDSLMFESPSGENFSIDFEEGDYSFDNDSFSFRLKSLGITFEENWCNIETTPNINFENDYDLFKVCDLVSIVLYLPEELLDNITNLNDLKCSVEECVLYVGSGEVIYNQEYITVEI